MLRHDYLIASFYKMVLQVVDDEVNRDSVLFCLHLRSPSWHYNVGEFHRRLNKL